MLSMFFEPPIQYDMPVYRPPSEGRSLLFQVTIGCSNNKCTYCDMYRSKKYRERSFHEIFQDISKAAEYYRSAEIEPQKIFFCDGDALGASTELLVQCLDAANTFFPNLKRVGVYATAENILNKSEEELKLLASKKMNIAYLGLETGDDKILHMIVKGNNSAEMIEASLKIKRCGFKLSTIAMLGIGGQRLSKQHIENTAKVLTQTCPEYFSFLTTFAVPGTPYHKMVERGLISPLTSKELFTEMYEILNKTNFDLNPVTFRANHVSNMYPLGGELPRDKANILATIKSWIDQTPLGTYPPIPNQM